MSKKQKKRGNTVAASSRCSILPEDLIILILLKLPMRSIICCKCVCKSWHKLLSHPSFTNAYMSAWPPSMLPTWVIFRKWPLEILHDPKFDPLPHPLLDFLGEKVIPCASSNGLLCCSSESTMGLLYVCNPMTREFKALPVLDDPFDYIPFAGFSFSPSTGCFMVAVRTWLTSGIVVFDSSTSPSGEWRRFHVLAQLHECYLSVAWVSRLIFARALLVGIREKVLSPMASLRFIGPQIKGKRNKFVDPRREVPLVSDTLEERMGKFEFSISSKGARM